MEVMLFIYKRLKKDFEFIENYGFHYAYKLKSNIAPGIFIKKKKRVSALALIM